MGIVDKVVKLFQRLLREEINISVPDCSKYRAKVEDLQRQLDLIKSDRDIILAEKKKLEKEVEELKKSIEKQKAQKDKTEDKTVYQTTQTFFKDLSHFTYLENTDNKHHGTPQVIVCDYNGCYRKNYVFKNSALCLYSDLDVILNYGGVNKLGLSAPKVFNGCLQAVQEMCDYITDKNAWGRSDSWTPANIVQLLRRDDCESLSALVVSAFKWYEMKYGMFKDWEAAVAIGMAKFGRSWGGHGFPMLLYKEWDEEKCLIGEATMPYKQEAKPVSELKKKYKADSWLVTFPAVGNYNGIWNLKEEAMWWKRR